MGHIDVPMEETWRVFRIMAEFIEGFEELSHIEPAVSIFGSARTNKDDKYYQLGYETSKLLAEAGFNIITGGGGGIMEAANKGAAEAGAESIGLNIELPMEQVPNEYQTKSMRFKYFFCRKVMFLKYAHGFIALPGGFGTMDEVFESLVLIQTYKQAYFPVVLMGQEYWQEMLDWISKRMCEQQNYINSEDRDFVDLTDEPEEAVKIIVDFHRKHGSEPLKPRPPKK